MPLAYHNADKAETQELIKELQKRFAIKELGALTQVLGLRVTRDRRRRTLVVDQTAATNKVLKAFGFGSGVRTEHVPARVGIKLPALGAPSAEVASKRSAEAERSTLTVANFISLVGALLYIAGKTRPDIAYAVGVLSRYTSQPTAEILELGKQVLRYLAGTASLGVTFSYQPDGLTLYGFSDSDWAADYSSGKSVSGVVFMLAGGPVSWRSTKQTTVALSSSEAEYVAASEAAREVSFLRMLLAELGIAQPNATVLFMDNQTSIKFVEEEGCTPRRKHINVKHHFIREKFMAGIIKPVWIPTAENVADILTKPLPRSSFELLREIILGRAAAAK